MIKNKYLFFLFLLLIFITFILTSAAKTSKTVIPSIKIPKGKALIYIYRPTAWAFAVEYKVYANEKYVITLPINSYYPYITNPGKIVFMGKTGVKKEITLNAKAGYTYYLLSSITPGAFVGRPYFKFVTKEVWLKDTKDYPLKLAKRK